jgi:hypothetical protein
MVNCENSGGSDSSSIQMRQHYSHGMKHVQNGSPETFGKASQDAMTDSPLIVRKQSSTNKFSASFKSSGGKKRHQFRKMLQLSNQFHKEEQRMLLIQEKDDQGRYDSFPVS